MPDNTDKIGHMRRKSTGHLMRASSKHIKLWAPFTVDINRADGQADPALTSPVNFLLTFSDAPTCTNTQLLDFIALTGTAGATTKSVTGTGTTRNVAISGMTGPGTVIINIAADQFQRDGGQYNEAATLTDNSIDFHGLFVTITKAPGQIGKENDSSERAYGDELNFTVTFSESVSDFTAASCTKHNTMPGAVFTVTGNGSVYNVRITGQTADGWSQWKILAGACHNSYGGTNALTYSPALYWDLPKWRGWGYTTYSSFRAESYMTCGQHEDINLLLSTAKDNCRAGLSPYNTASPSAGFDESAGIGYHGYQAWPLGWPSEGFARCWIWNSGFKYGTSTPVPITDMRVTISGSAPPLLTVSTSAPSASTGLSGSPVDAGTVSLTAYVDMFNGAGAGGFIWLTLGTDFSDLVITFSENHNPWDPEGDECQWYLGTQFCNGTEYWYNSPGSSGDSGTCYIDNLQVFY